MNLYFFLLDFACNPAMLCVWPENSIAQGSSPKSSKYWICFKEKWKLRSQLEILIFVESIVLILFWQKFNTNVLSYKLLQLLDKKQQQPLRCVTNSVLTQSNAETCNLHVVLLTDHQTDMQFNITNNLFLFGSLLKYRGVNFQL